jgi:predicted TIM-barrel fold metal-dependent hydrolase
MTVAQPDLRERVQALRSEIEHPIIDSDGHIVEFLPDLAPFLRRVGSADDLRVQCATAAWGRSYTPDWSRMSRGERARRRVARPSSNDFSCNPIDRATTMLPELLYQRLDEIGIDFALVYPSLGNFLSGLGDEKTRRAACHEFNEYYMALFRNFSDRIAVPAVIPMYTPNEAVDELEHAAGLGYKVALIPAYVRRYADDAPGGLWFDAYGLDSMYDYDPVWTKTGELGMPVSGHGNAYGAGWPTRSSISNFSFSHMGHFAAAQEFLCRSLLMGGVTRRFPGQRFSFLEGGVAWAAMLYSAAISHWEKRNRAAATRHLGRNAFSESDKAEFLALVSRYGGTILERSGPAALEQIEEWLWAGEGEGGPEDDEWEAVGITSKEDFIDRFIVPFAFGAESDDPMTVTAFTRANPLGGRLKVLFSSDMGHFDVPDMLGILGEAHEGVDHGWMTAEDFRDFAFTNAARFFTDMNPRFFVATRVERAVNELLAELAPTEV